MGDREEQDAAENLDSNSEETSSPFVLDWALLSNIGRNIARSYLDMNGQLRNSEISSNDLERGRAINQGARQPWPPLDRSPRTSLESGNAASDDDGVVLRIGEESAVVDWSDAESIGEMKMAVVDNEVKERKEDVEKRGTNDGGFFDCSICFDMAKDPIVTCCGHLFCWPCIYRWLHGHSDARECPVCKGAITVNSVTPIYGRGKNITRGTEVNLGFKIPPRPSAGTVLKEVIQRTTPTSPFEREIWRSSPRFDTTQDFDSLQSPEPDGSGRDIVGSHEDLLNQRLIHSLQASNTNYSVDLTRDGEDRLVRITLHSPLSHGRAHSQNNLTAAFVPSVGSAGGAGDAYRPLAPLTPRRHQELSPSMGSVSSVVAVIHGEAETDDTALETDPMVFSSASSSGDGASRASYAEIGDSRRQRLN